MTCYFSFLHVFILTLLIIITIINIDITITITITISYTLYLVLLILDNMGVGLFYVVLPQDGRRAQTAQTVHARTGH